MVGLYRYFKGYYYIRLNGEYTGRILNRMMAKKINVWNIKRISQKTVELYVSKNGLEIVKELAEENNTIVEIITYNGFDSVVLMMKKRWMFFYAFITVSVCILFSSSFIWKIDIPDVSYINKDEVIDALSDMGIKEGALRKPIDYTYVSNALVTRFDSLIWANVELNGTRLKVTFVPRKKPPEIVPINTPTNIVSKKDGIIENVIVENGEKKVEKGDTVVKGQVLISGVVLSDTLGTRYVNSQGSITANVWTEKTTSVSLYEYEKVYTGNKKTYRELEIPFIKIPLYFKKNIDFYNYESIIKEKSILFTTIRENSFLEYTLKKVEISLDDAIKKGEEKLKKEIENECMGIISYETTYELKDNETVFVRVLSKSLEEIGEEVEIKK